MPIRTALLSVSDKTGLFGFASALAKRGVTLLSSGGTAKALAAEGIAVQSVEDYTGSPEVMGGRVKTLHPRIHGGILAREGTDDQDLARLGAKPIDLVVVNLYPFEKVAANPLASLDELIENIDIGGPSMVRSAAKNHARVAIVCDPADYERVLAEIEQAGTVGKATRLELAAKAFAHTAAYDAAISGLLSGPRASDADATVGANPYPQYLTLPFERAYGLRYGENPHQSGAFYVERSAPAGSLARAESLGAGGKELSFNNLVDVDAALEAVREFDGQPAAVVVKHTNPCGVASAATLVEAYRLARDADALSAFGGIVALNREVDAETAALLAETFLECVVAPSFAAAALETLRTKKNLRLIATGAPDADHAALQFKRVSGGLVVQSRDDGAAGQATNGKVVTKRAPTADEMRGLEFAWRVCKHVKSNAIVLAKGELATDRARTVGVGAGQMSRVVSVQIACEKAAGEASGSVLASDAFFPFPDGVEAAAKNGITAIAQPGGSVKDADVIAAADRLGLAMVLTGVRHFRH
ncbi:MAG: bifunctional phosphoribosylaminoimidazolecarboxamide formyltransferase/IMP cyclohydrolase [Labilithrix sp.]|nr:bifunctional phosphoribosylaminoimidazolecarboxamide formyltransferase/IMP cyclohydrolase [Labilithrix sp.]MBX3220188.1 bifunctional phosphoribosylaminoimidazolecarboxamide formyltransferase/IMP cyclohydrolase [Labilithrix sp.]